MSHALSAHAAKKSAPARVPPASAVQRGRAIHQLSMFEPQGETLALLVATHQFTSVSERKRAANLVCSGFASAATARFSMASEAEQMAFVCEMALQFEQLAGLV